jgi:hypothetical protein
MHSLHQPHYQYFCRSPHTNLHTLTIIDNKLYYISFNTTTNSINVLIVMTVSIFSTYYQQQKETKTNDNDECS